MNFNELRTRDKLLSQIAPGIQTVTPEAMKGTRWEKTAETLSALLTSLESLKAGFLDLAESGNAYAANAIFRAFLEHTLKMLGIFLKASTEGTDDFATRYLELHVFEASQYVRAIEAAKLDVSVAQNSPLAPWFKEASGLSKKERQSLEEPFKYRKLIETISDLIGPDQPSFLLKIIPNYSELSGFVHGGPSTSLILAAAETMQAEKLLHDADLVIYMACSAKRWLLELVAAMRPEFQPHLDQIEEAMGRLG